MVSREQTGALDVNMPLFCNYPRMQLKPHDDCLLSARGCPGQCCERLVHVAVVRLIGHEMGRETRERRQAIAETPHAVRSGFAPPTLKYHLAWQ